MIMKSIIARFLKRLSQITKVLAQERPRVAFFRFIGWITYIIEGKVSAYFVGWEKAYLGRGSRVIGTRYIAVGERLSVGRYAWIEAVTECGEEKFQPVISFGVGFNASERLHISAINRIEIGDNCLFGSSVYVSDHNHGSYKGEKHSHPNQPPIKRELVTHGAVIIGSNVWIGDNVTIVGPVKIGNGVVVGANSVVTRDVPDYVIVGGIPAKILKRFNFSTSKWDALEAF